MSLRFRFAPFVLGALIMSFSGCKKVCDTDNVPQYPITSGVRSWAAPYPKDAVLRFRNAGTGYVRSYRVTSAENQMDGVNAGINLCPLYFREFSRHALQRVDSTGTREDKEIMFRVETANSTQARASLTVGSTNVDLPIQEVEDGTQALSPATFSGRSYPAVLGGGSSLAFPGSRVVVRLYVTKTEGLIRFEERGGTVWDRL